MARIRDLTDEDGRDDAALTETSGGMLDRQYLQSDPPVAYLDDHESPQYVLRNRKGGATIAGDAGEQHLAPADDGGGVAVVTDVRVHVVVGTAEGDRARSLRLDEVVEAEADSEGLLSTALVVETVDGDRWRFPTRGDVAEVADYVDGTGQVWANAQRLIEEAAAEVETGRGHLETGEFEAARESVSAATDLIETARERIGALGGGAEEALAERVDPIRRDLRGLHRKIAATKGSHHHAAAQRAWEDDHAFDRAADHYETAVEEYRRAIEADGDSPPTDALRRRLRGAAGEREILRVAPMADARAAQEVARTTDDPDEAATEWETALTCYREAVSLDWGGDGRTFLVDRDLARERAVEACDAAIDARLTAAREWRAAGDRIAVNGRHSEARQAYERARGHVERAREIADQLDPDRIDDVEECLETVERRLRGEGVPASEPDESTLPVERVRDVLASDGAAGGAGSVEVDPASEGEGPTPAITRVGDEPPDAAGATATRVGTAAGSEPGAGTAADDTVAGLRALDGRAFTRLVAECWEHEGWSTTVFPAANETVYDVVAVRGDDRLLLWTVQNPDGGRVGPTAIRRCATARDSSGGEERATLVTTGRITAAARRRAEELDVSVLDGAALADRVEAAGLGDRLA